MYLGSPSVPGRAPSPHLTWMKLCGSPLSFLGISPEVKGFLNRFNRPSRHFRPSCITKNGSVHSLTGKPELLKIPATLSTSARGASRVSPARKGWVGEKANPKHSRCGTLVSGRFRASVRVRGRESSQINSSGSMRRRYQAAEEYTTKCWSLYKNCPNSAPVAQLDRAADFESAGWEFEPPRARQFSSIAKQ